MHHVGIWILVVLFALNSGMNVVNIGQPRKPITNGEAVFVMIANGIIIGYLLSL